jgi:hypothetical protein
MHYVQNPKYNFFLMLFGKKKINSWPRAFITRGHIWLRVKIHVASRTRVIIHAANCTRVIITRGQLLILDINFNPKCMYFI